MRLLRSLLVSGISQAVAPITVFQLLRITGNSS